MQEDAYLMPASPAGGRQPNVDYRPSIQKAVGHVPACLVNASVTYCSNDRIYAFGGFDQDTDEGWHFPIWSYLFFTECEPSLTHNFGSLQPRALFRLEYASMGPG
jgi:hypothetical protein